MDWGRLGGVGGVKCSVVGLDWGGVGGVGWVGKNVAWLGEVQ